MHPQAYRAVAEMARELNLHKPREAFLGGLGLDIGGVDVNGSARLHLRAVRTWVGLDIEPGPGVDVVHDATSWEGMEHMAGYYDVVLCTEVLEHVRNWRALVHNAGRVLRPGGHLILTCAGRGRTPHGARGDRRPALGEYYGNVESQDLQDVLKRHFSDWSVRYNPKPGDLYAWGRA